MKKKLKYQAFRKSAFFFILVILTLNSNAQNSGDQKISFGVHFDPVISWFGSDFRDTRNEGARPGFNLGLTFNKYFTSNYSFSTGISLINAGGRLSSSDTTVMEFSNFNSTVLPGQTVLYKIQYLSIPLGLKLQTNEIGYMTFFTDLGLDPKVVIGGKADIPSIGIKGENATGELRMFNMSYHVTAGFEYSLGGTTAFVLGIGFENNFFDVTKENNKQPVDKVTHKLLSFRLGLNF